MMQRLTQKQERFVAEYLSNGGNATAAAQLAYDCSSESARRIGSENLTKVDIQRAIQSHTGNVLQEAMQVVRDALQARTKSGLPHHSVRLRAAEMVFKLANAYTAKDQTHQDGFVPSPEFRELSEWLEQQPLEVAEWVFENDRIPDEEEIKRITDNSVEEF